MFFDRNEIDADWLWNREQSRNCRMRYCWALLSGFLITAALFVLMHYLITGSEVEIAPTTKGGILTITPHIEDQKPAKKDPRPKPPPPVTPEPITKFNFVSPDGVSDDIPTIEFVPPDGKHEAQVGAADGGILPIVAVAPTYPRRMAARGIEGWVLLEFSVDPISRVQNASVVNAKPTTGFNKAALEAVSRYKYKPKVVSGNTTWVHGVQTRIVFDLEEQ
jgi:protein TonB